VQAPCAGNVPGVSFALSTGSKRGCFFVDNTVAVVSWYFLYSTDEYKKVSKGLEAKHKQRECRPQQISSFCANGVCSSAFLSCIQLSLVSRLRPPSQ
jgi:hypothetical protein